MIFPKWTNLLGPAGVIGGFVAAMGTIFVFWYWFTDKHLQVGYQPKQPILFSHKTHATNLGVDCRFCHSGVERSYASGVPASEICMGCHSQILPDSPEIQKLKAYHESGKPIPWIRVHKVPEYAYFNHSVHVNKGVGCVSCHGNVHQMDEIRQSSSLTMGWCLDCHNAPNQHLRDKSALTAANWTPPDSSYQTKLSEQYHINTRIDCSTCHR